MSTTPTSEVNGMRLLQKVKDGGKLSTVDAYILIEIKCLFSIALLRFNQGSRENFHSHAFNALTWFIKGTMREKFLDGREEVYTRRLLPKFTPRASTHKVIAERPSWCFTLRGPWSKTWSEFSPSGKTEYLYTHKRKLIGTKHYA